MALSALADVLDSGLNLTDSPALKEQEKGRDLSQARHLAYGVLRWLTALDYLAQQMLSKPLKPRDRDIYRLILLGVYQLWKDETAPHAAIHETAECARKLNKPWAVGLINAVLRRFQRERETRLDGLEGVAEQFAHPSWILEQLKTDWPEDWQKIAYANNQQAPLFLRINRSSAESKDVITRLEQQEFRVSTHPLAADAICIKPAANLSSIAGFSQGQLSVQDPAAQLAVDLLDLQPGIRLLDACAAPGGKTCHVLEREASVKVVAIDQHKKRIELIKENLVRLKLNCELVVADAATPGKWWDGTPFQRILLDAPCSASGVIRRHPEIKHLRKAAQVDAAVKLQKELLSQLWPLLEPGGILVYATCSVFKNENSHQISHFLKQQADAEEVPVGKSWGINQPHGRQILPGELDMDGFYYAILGKKP
jgi:16S rRNA (cytosine967-C5)-methyltransferase